MTWLGYKDIHCFVLDSIEEHHSTISPDRWEVQRLPL